MGKITFNNTGQTFYPALKKEVEKYFKDNQLKPTGDIKLYSKTILGIGAAVFLYLFLLLANYSVAEGILLSVFFGFALVFIAFNTMHDACHESFSGRKKVNMFMSYTMNALGGNAFLWKIKHNILHHTYTNVEGVDDDISQHPFLRFCQLQKRFRFHKYQFIYMFFLYAIMSFTWMTFFDFRKYFSKRINTTTINKIDTKDHFVFWISKLLYAFFYVAIPVSFVGFEAWLVGFAIMHVTIGMSLSIVFQLAHIVENTTFEGAENKPKLIDVPWAVHEVKTTSNFAPHNGVATFLLGGLNFQIEHHLFPRVSHIHYPAISKIVKEQCFVFNLPYNYYPTMFAAIKSHIRVMRKLGS